jgi:predicted PurR-regulated permease PerM
VESLVNQVLGIVQPALGQAGGLLSKLASSTLSSLGWGFFILLVSYFTLADAGRVPDMLARVEIPGYNADLRRLGRQLGRIWNAFMRGQLTIIALTIVSYFILLTVFGVRNALALALLTGAARLVPYIGPLINWITISVIAFFQSSNYFGLEQWQFVLMVLISGIILDQIFDNLISPRVYSSVLNVHPAAVLITAIIAANLLGFIGLLLAAPGLATLSLFAGYAIRKMLDLGPWPEDEKLEQSGIFTISTLRRWIARLQRYLNKKRTDSSQEITPK